MDRVLASVDSTADSSSRRAKGAALGLIARRTSVTAFVTRWIEKEGFLHEVSDLSKIFYLEKGRFAPEEDAPQLLEQLRQLAGRA
jgi:hypothetical protein